MPFIVIIIGAILVISAFNETHGQLAQALEQDIPGYFKWAMAIAVILGLGFIPGMKIPSRYLIALVALVVVLTNFNQIKQGLMQFAAGDQTTPASGNVDPTTAYVQSGGQGGLPTQAQIAGEAGSGGGGTQMAGGGAASFNPLNPNSYIGLAAGFGGLA